MGTVIKWHIHARTAVLRGSRAARTSSVIPFTRRFFAISSTKNQLAAGIEARARHVETPSESTMSSTVWNMRQTSVGAARTCQDFGQMFTASELSALPQGTNGGDMPSGAKSIGRRLLKTREALGLSQAEFCRQIGVQRNLYNPFEKGRRRITIDVATKIRDRYGISLDWIYLADQRALPSDLYQKLASIAA